MAKMRSSMILSILLAGSIGLVSGCSLVNPYQHAERNSVLNNPQADEQVKLEAARKYANDMITTYQTAMGDQAELTSGLGLGLIPLSAAALGLGITGGSSSAIAALGLTGAAGYGVGTWLSNKDRIGIYNNGVKALSCAKTAALALDVPDDTPRSIEQLLTNEGLLGKIATVESDIGAIRAWIASNPGKTNEDKANPAIAAAQPLVDSGKQLLSNAARIDNQLRHPGELLAEAVDQIAAAVDEALQKTQPDASSLAGVLKGFPQLASSVGVNVPSGPATTKPSAQVGIQEKLALNPTLDDLVTELNRDAATLRDAEAQASLLLDTLSASLQANSFESCKVTYAPSLTLTPSGAVSIVSAGDTNTKHLIVSGGKLPYAGTLADTIKGVSATIIPMSNVVEISADKGTEATTTLIVSDAAGTMTTVSVTVTKPPK